MSWDLFAVLHLFVSNASIRVHPIQTQSRHTIDTCTPCTLFPTRHTCVLVHNTCQRIPGVSFSMTDTAHHGAPPPPRHIPRGPQGSCYCFSPCATCAYYGLNLNQESREALNVTEYIFIGLHFVLLTAVNNTLYPSMELVSGQSNSHFFLYFLMYSLLFI